MEDQREQWSKFHVCLNQGIVFLYLVPVTASLTGHGAADLPAPATMYKTRLLPRRFHHLLLCLSPSPHTCNRHAGSCAARSAPLCLSFPPTTTNPENASPLLLPSRKGRRSGFGLHFIITVIVIIIIVIMDTLPKHPPRKSFSTTGI